MKRFVWALSLSDKFYFLEQCLSSEQMPLNNLPDFVFNFIAMAVNTKK